MSAQDGASRDLCAAGEPSPFSLERLSAFVDGDLPASELHSVRQHVEACPRCAAHAAELGALTRAARTLEVPEPPPTLWPSIEGALARETERRWWVTWRPFGIGAVIGSAVGAAVALLVVVGGSLHRVPAAQTALTSEAAAREALAQAPPAPTDPLLAEAEQEFARAAAVYERSIEKVRGLLVREESRWSPEVRARYDERLARLDEAIARTREVARRAPGESEGNEQLFAAYQQKIAFLTATVHRGGGWGPGAP